MDITSPNDQDPPDYVTGGTRGSLKRKSDNEYDLKEGSCWITVNNISVYVLKTDKGVVVEICPLDCEFVGTLGSTWATFAEAQEEINENTAKNIGA